VRGRLGQHGVGQLVIRVTRAGWNSNAACALRRLVGQTLERELRVRHSQQRAIFADVEFDAIVFVGDVAAPETYAADCRGKVFSPARAEGLP